MSDLIDRQEAIEAILNLTDFQTVRELYEYTQEHHLTEEWLGGVNDAIDAVIEVPPAQPELKDWKTDHGFMWLCPNCGLAVHSDFDKCVRCGNKRPSA